MGRHLQKRNMHTIYIRNEHMQIWDKFIKTIEKDDVFKKLQFKNKSGLISIAIMTLINTYIVESNNENETPIEDNN